MESTWEARDLPVLDAIVTALDDPSIYPLQVRDVAKLTGMDEERVYRSARALAGTYIELKEVWLAASQVRIAFSELPTPHAAPSGSGHRRRPGQTESSKHSSMPLTRSPTKRRDHGFDRLQSRWAVLVVTSLSASFPAASPKPWL